MGALLDNGTAPEALVPPRRLDDALVCAAVAGVGGHDLQSVLVDGLLDESRRFQIAKHVAAAFNSARWRGTSNSPDAHNARFCAGLFCEQVSCGVRIGWRASSDGLFEENRCVRECAHNLELSVTRCAS